jgi:hypothetical protein
MAQLPSAFRYLPLVHASSFLSVRIAVKLDELEEELDAIPGYVE